MSSVSLNFANFVLQFTQNAMNYKDYITRNPDIMLGKPTIKGTRITVELIIRKMSAGYSISDILEAYPHLKSEQVFAALEYAAEVIANEQVIETS